MVRSKRRGDSYVGLMACANCGKSIGVLLDRRFHESFEYGQQYTTGDLCDTCEKLIQEENAAVAAGGVYIKCKECGFKGALRRLSDGAKALCDDVRRTAFGS